MSKTIQNIKAWDSDAQSFSGRFTSPQILFRHAEDQEADKIAVREKAHGIWQPFSWREFLEHSRNVALGLMSLGFQRGENIGLITDNRPEWLFSVLGAQAAGAVTVNLFTSSMGTELVYDLSRLNTSFVFVENRRQVEKLLAHRDDLPLIKRVIFIDPANMLLYSDDTWLVSYNQLIDLGKQLGEKKPALFTDELWKGKPDDAAIILMTSGTTGIPKPAMISYENLMETASRWRENVVLTAGDNWVSLSPCAGLLEQTWCLGTALACGVTINFPEAPGTVMNDMREIGPSVIVNYPVFWESLMSLIKVELEESGPVRKWIYNRSYKTGSAVYDLESMGAPVPLSLKLLQKLFGQIITIPLMNRLGLLRLRFAYTGGNPISPDVIKFFKFHGLDLKQCYGLAETAGMFQFQEAGDRSADTVGKPLSGNEITITEDLEILISGKFNFSGYYNDPETSEDTLKNGLLRTGDAGYLDNDGRLVIAGRKADIIHSENGQIFSRDFTETRLKESPYIKEAVIWGKGKPYLIAFIGIDLENTLRWAERHNIAYYDFQDFIRHSAVEELIKDEIHELNFRLPDHMRIRRIILINKLLESDEEFTKAGMARRKFLFEQYRDILDAMYSDRESTALKGRMRDNNDDIRMIKTRVKIISVSEGDQ
jgi:long-chain acyl-CoA synthetase